MAQMKILVLENDAEFRGMLKAALMEVGVGGISFEAFGDDVSATFIGTAVETFDPDLVVMSWKHFGDAALRVIKLHGCERHLAGHPIEVWVWSDFPPRHLHRQADIADLILPKSLVTTKVLRALLHKARELWEAREQITAAS